MTGWLLGPGALVPPLAVAGWLLATFPLVLLGHDRPVPAVLLGGAAAAALAVRGVRGACRPDGPAVAGWATLAVVAAFVGVALTTSAQHVVVRRDPGTYALEATALARAGRLTAGTDAAAFGRDPAVRYGSPGFYQRRGHVVPQFPSGLAMVLAPAGWLRGVPGVLHGNAVVGGAALLAVAGLAARVAGARVAPFAAAGAGLAYPVLHAARASDSEPLALLLLAGGLCLLGERRHAFLGGLVAALAALVRVDALAAVAPLLGYAAATPGATPVAAGVAAGAAVGLLDGGLLHRPYLGSVAGELVVVAVLAVVFAGAGAALRSRPAGRLTRREAPLVAGAVPVVAVALWLRPLWQTPHQPGVVWAGMVSALQRAQRLPVDGTRTYAEHSMHWLGWWLGAPLLVASVAGLTVLAGRRVARRVEAGVDPAPFLLVAATTAAAVLWRPSITPDHPWADRRFVPVVLPALVVCAGWLLGRLRGVAFGVVAVLVLVPVALATAPLAAATTERGEPRAVGSLCRELPHRAAVVVTGSRASLELPETLRLLCRVPVGVVTERALRGVLPRLGPEVAAGDRRLVVVAEDAAPLRAAGLAPRLVADLRTSEDARTLTRPPRHTVPLRIRLWLAPAAT